MKNSSQTLSLRAGVRDYMPTGPLATMNLLTYFLWVYCGISMADGADEVMDLSGMWSYRVEHKKHHFCKRKRRLSPSYLTPRQRLFSSLLAACSLLLTCSVHVASLAMQPRLVELWQCRAQHLRKLYCDKKHKQSGSCRPVYSSQCCYWPVVLVVWIVVAGSSVLMATAMKDVTGLLQLWNLCSSLEHNFAVVMLTTNERSTMLGCLKAMLSFNDLKNIPSFNEASIVIPELVFCTQKALEQELSEKKSIGGSFTYPPHQKDDSSYHFMDSAVPPPTRERNKMKSGSKDDGEVTKQLLMKSGDIESNPGPYPGPAYDEVDFDSERDPLSVIDVPNLGCRGTFSEDKDLRYDSHGKWFLFRNFEDLNATWQVIKREVESGRLGATGAFCSTLYYNPFLRGPGPATTGRINVYAKEENFMDVGMKLIHLPVVRHDIIYKTQEATIALRSSHLVPEQVSQVCLFWNKGNPSTTLQKFKQSSKNRNDRDRYDPSSDKWKLNVANGASPFNSELPQGKWILVSNYHRHSSISITNLWHALKNQVEKGEIPAIKMECPAAKKQGEDPEIHVYASEKNCTDVGKLLIHVLKKDIVFESKDGLKSLYWNDGKPEYKKTSPLGRTSPSEERTTSMKEGDTQHLLEPSEAEIEKSHRICEKVLRAKSLISIITVVVNYLGLPRSGKTTFRRRINGEIENILKAREQGETEQPSTGVMEDGGQIVIRPSCQEMGAIIKSNVWRVLKSLEDEVNLLNQFFQQVEVPEEMPEGVPESNVPLHSDTRNVTFSNSKIVLSATSNEEASGTAIRDGDGDDDDEMFSIIREAMATDHWEEVKYLLEDTILLSCNDTGGHAEFLDLQAALVQGPSINLLFSRLVDDLDSLFKIYYTNEEGKSTGKEDSTMTVEEVLYQALASIASCSKAFSMEDSADDKNSESKAMLVGTHLDMVSKEEFREKDEHFQKRIESTEFYRKGIIEYASEDQLMLAVDNMHGDQAEIESIQKVLERVIKKSFKKVPIPAAWLVLSLYLRKKKFCTISLNECEKLAGKLGISQGELQDALWYLHHHIGVLLYYPDVTAMKDTVICQTQVVFDSTSNLIRNTFTFDSVGRYVSHEFRKKGQFSLKYVKKASSDSLIPLEKLVMLLQHLNVLTPIPLTSSARNNPEPTYFMPCILQTARANELKITLSSGDPAPLMLHYECGYVPLGLFPALITNLVSQQREGWKLIQNDLYKNKVQFRVGKNYDTLTLISRPRYFEISLSRNEDLISASLCAHVRGVIQSTLNSVTLRMNCNFEMGYKFGFECPTHPGKEHLCVLASENEEFMECLKNREDVKPVRLEHHHKIWFEEVPVFTALPSESCRHGNDVKITKGKLDVTKEAVAEVAGMSLSSSEELIPTLKTLSFLKWRDDVGDLQNLRLEREVSARWKDMGIMLNLTLNDLNALERQYQGSASDIWREVMSHWLAGGGGCDYPPTWEGLYGLLNDIELSELARRLKKAVAGYCPF